MAVDAGGFSTSMGSGFHASLRAPAAAARKILGPGLACGAIRREEGVEMGWKGRWMKADAHWKKMSAERCFWSRGGAFHPAILRGVCSLERGDIWQVMNPMHRL